MKSFSSTIVMACAVLALPVGSQVGAAPILWSSGSGGNDHYYEFIQVADPYTGNNNTWQTASAAAAASVHNGQNGYLATVTSQAENDFLFSMVPAGLPQGSGAWLGGKSPEGWLVGPEAGQAFGFTNFGGVEPNNSGLVYMNVGAAFANVNSGQWADDSGVQGVPDPNLDRVIGYFVEYNAITPIPEPATWLLVAAGFACLPLAKRAQKGRGSVPQR